MDGGDLQVLDFVLDFYRDFLCETARGVVASTCVDVIQVSVDGYDEPLYISKSNDVYVLCDSSYRGRKVGVLRDGALCLYNRPLPPTEKLTI